MEKLHSTLCTDHCRVYNYHYTLFTDHCKVYYFPKFSTLYTIHCKFDNFLLSTLNTALYTVQCKLESFLYKLYSVQCTLYIVQCIRYSLHCTMYSLGLPIHPKFLNKLLFCHADPIFFFFLCLTTFRFVRYIFIFLNPKGRPLWVTFGKVVQ